MRKTKGLFKQAIWGLFSLLLTIVFIIGCALIFLEWQLPNINILKEAPLQVPMRIYTADEKLIAEFGEERRTPITIDKVPKQFINAILATEDQRYYEHGGVDFFGLIRALCELAVTGERSQGGSTITMQVARNYFLTRKKTYSRKIKEILLAIKIDNEFSKDKILELYLNRIYFGNRAYGVAAAAQVYYGKSLDQLTLAECAMLAGLPKAPSTLNPLANADAALERRNHVLERMYIRGFIKDKKVYEEALKAPDNAVYHGQVAEVYAPYVAELARNGVIDHLGEKVAYTQGLKVYTTVNSETQNAATHSLQRALLAYDQRHGGRRGPEGALVSLNPNNGAVLALVGGYDYEKSNFNCATQAERQPGSNFKPFIYSAALSKGYTLATIVNDAPIVIDDPSQENLWRPSNDTHDFYGPIRLRIALAKSRNTVSIRLLQDIGLDYAIQYVTRFGFETNQLPHAISLALGTASVTPLQQAAGYAVFANGGFKVEPYLIDKIINNQGTVIYQSKPKIACEDCKLTADQRAPRAITAQNAYLMTQALQDVIKIGTGTAAKVLKRDDIAGKTGTTNQQIDAWFTGFNSDVVTTCWVGFLQPRSLHEYGAQAALPMWIDFMRQVLANKPQHTMSQPADVVSVRIDPNTGLSAPDDKNAIFEVFTKDSKPKEQSHPVQESDSDSENNNAPANNQTDASESSEQLEQQVY
jgi:penicillin-binding protein 1A